MQSHASPASEAADVSTERGLDDSRLLSLTSYMFERIARLGRPAILVLHTLERAIRRAPMLAGRVIARLRATWSQHPAFTLIVSGRGPLDMPELEDAPRLC